jgi:hypothetical protein
LFPLKGARNYIDLAGLVVHIKDVNSIAKVGKTLALLVVLAAVAIGAGLLYAWYVGNHEVVTPVVSAESVHSLQPATTEPVLAGPVKASGNYVTQAPVQPGWTNKLEDVDSRPWEQRLDGILLGAGEVNDKADMILKLMKVAPTDAEVELAQHLINMVQDDHYDGAAELLTNATTQPAVATVLMNDLLNRRNTLKLPMLLAIARNDDHPLKDQAKDMLELFLQADYATNWDQWASAVDTWLQQNQ